MQSTTARRPQTTIDLEPTEETIATPSPKVPVTLTQFEIIDLWENAILNDRGFIYLALTYDKANDRPFDLEDFVFRWKGTPNDAGKVKELKRSSVFRVVETLEEKELLEVEKVNIQLSLL
jgi:hypothetical protein